jgi:hypothetical protein
MAISNSSKIWFSPKPTKDGVYRYDIVINGVTVFVGNTYLTANQNPIIDIAGVLKQFVDVNEPPYSSLGELSGVYKNIDVKLYLDNNVYTNSISQFFIYENPNFNSDITTPILSNLKVEGINTMPMLQGWDYFPKRGYLLPTYPAVASDVFTFDMICAMQNQPFTHNIKIYYNNGLMYQPQSIQLAGGGCYQYSLPLNWLLQDVSGTNIEYNAISELFNFSEFASDYTFTDSSVVYSETLDEEGDIYLMRTYGNIYCVDEEADINNAKHIVNFYSKVYYTTGGVDTVNFIRDGVNNYSYNYVFNNILNIDRISVILVNDDNTETILDVSPNLTAWNKINAKDNAKDSLTISLMMQQNGENIVNEYITIQTQRIVVDMTATVCDVKHMNISTQLSEISNNRYDYKIANFDSKSRYFLKWKDRYGMPQVQPFGGTYKYGEDITKNTITNHLNTNKIVNITTKSKWLLNTKWIKQEFYPFYESIFVSPYLILYDAKEDKQYSVILTNTEYEEKTFNNQNRQLFNLQLTVELDTSETMVY